MIPNKEPQMKRDQLLELLRSTYPNLVLPKFAIIGVRGYYKKSMGNPTKNDRAIYDDAMFILTDNELHAFNANCDPSKYDRGIANLKAGVWPCYQFDIHGGRTAQYPAICQRKGKVTVIRDGKGEDTGMFGINIHKGGHRGTSSEGCQTIPPTQWDRFYNTAVRLASGVYGVGYKKETITYILLEA